MRNRHRKLIREDRTISQLSPTKGSKNAPDKLLEMTARLLKLHRRAKEAASRPLMEFLAIKSSTIRNMNIPIRL
jgi:hypothetical protein